MDWDAISVSTDDTAEVLSEHPGRVWRRVLILAVVCGVLVALATSSEVHTWLIKVLTTCEQVIAAHPLFGAIVFVVFAAVSAMIAFVSVAIIVPVAIVTWGEPVTLALLWAGWILGGMFAYSIGRLPGRRMVGWFVSNAALTRLEMRLGHRASFGLVVLVQLSLPSEIPGYVLGMLRYPFRRFLLALGLAELPYVVATVYMGSGLVEQRRGQILLFGAGLIVMSLLAVYLLKAKLQQARAPSEPQ
jgi:uncharacterized membrane protein YdjX (TVP38/TMEM64 family)